MDPGVSRRRVGRPGIGRSAALLGLVALVLGGCSDDDSGEEDSTGPRMGDLEESLCGSVTAGRLGDITGTAVSEYAYSPPSSCVWSDDDPLTGPITIRLSAGSYDARVEQQALNPNFQLEESEIDGVTVTLITAPSDATVIAAVDGEENPAVEISAPTLDQAKEIAEVAIGNIKDMVG